MDNLIDEVMKNAISLFVICLGLVLVFAGCDSDGGSEITIPKVQMTLDTDNLEPLKEGFSYKAWARVGEVYYGTEAFNVTATGQFLTAAGQFRNKSFVMETDISDANLVVISIEGKTGSGDRPSETVILASDVTGPTTNLTSVHPAALGVDISGLSGQFTVMTPSDIDPANEAHGIWFLTESGGIASAGLSLPTLNPGWTYEGWVEVGSVTLSTGLFTSANGNDASQAYSFPDVPLFPGEDFLINEPSGALFPLNLDGAHVFVTVEPSPDDNFEPYGLKIMDVQLPATVQGGTVHSLSSAGFNAPTASILIF